MKFGLVDRQGYVPDMNYGEAGQELACFVPTDYRFEQVSYVNGEEYYSDISQYVLEHNDRILVSFGDTESISKHLTYLESLKILDIPKKTPQYSGNEFNI